MSPLPTLLALSLIAAGGDPPLVRYVTKAETRSWEPIAIAEVEKMVEQAALQALTEKGAMKLERSGFADLKKGDYALVLSGRFVEEAELFSVYLTFGPGSKTDLPSFFATHTSRPLGKLPRAQMEALIREAASAAAKRMAEVLAPRLESVRLQIDAPPIDEAVLPLAWGPLDVPNVGTKSQAIKTLLDPRQDDSDRHKALSEISGFAFDQPAARNAILQCVLRDPSANIRARCVDALAPVARNNAPTQRLLLYAMRREVDDNVVASLVKVSQGFVGLSRGETIATWLELIASDAAPAGAVSRIAELLAKEGDVPNLDFAIAACLKQEALVYGKKGPCADTLLRAVPFERRPAVVYRFLEQANPIGSGTDRAYEEALEQVVGDRKNKTDPRMAALFLDVAEKPSLGRLRYKALYYVRDHSEPTPRNIERLLAIALDQRVATDAVRAIVEVVERSPTLATMAIGGLEKLGEQAHWFPRPSHGNPYEDLANAKKRLAQIESKGR